MLTFNTLGLIALAIIGVAILFKIYGVTFYNFVLIVIGLALISFVLLEQAAVLYYTHLVLHLLHVK